MTPWGALENAHDEVRTTNQKAQPCVLNVTCVKVGSPRGTIRAPVVGQQPARQTPLCEAPHGSAAVGEPKKAQRRLKSGAASQVKKR